MPFAISIRVIFFLIFAADIIILPVKILEERGKDFVFSDPFHWLEHNCGVSKHKVKKLLEQKYKNLEVVSDMPDEIEYEIK